MLGSVLQGFEDLGAARLNLSEGLQGRPAHGGDRILLQAVD